MVRQIYRQAAIDRLASPERLDRPYKLVRARAGLAIFSLVAVLVAGVGWALVSKANVKVAGRGIVLQKQGLLEITSNDAGRVEVLLLRPGDMVKAGAPVAEFRRSDLERELEKARAELEDARSRQSNRKEFFKAQNERATIAEEERLKGITQARTILERRIELFDSRLKELSALARRKIVVRAKVIEAEVQVANALERLAELNTQELQIKLKSLERRNRHEIALFDERLKINSLQRQVARLTQQLQERRFVRSPHSGTVVEVKVARGDVVAPGTALATIAPDADTSEPEIGVVFVTPRDGKRIKPGMSVEVMPSVYRKQEYGFIRGKVTFVSSVPATAEGMRSVLRNEQLVSQFSSGAAPFQVRVNFIRDPGTPSGLLWSSSRGPDAKVAPGTLIDAAILVERIPIANLVVPGLAQTMGVAGNE